MSSKDTVSGAAYQKLAMAVSTAMVEAQHGGMEIDEAACIAVQVAADYARGAYGVDYLRLLAEVVIDRGDAELPPCTISRTH